MELIFNPSPEQLLNDELPLFHQLQFHDINYKIPEYQFLFKEGSKQNVLYFHLEQGCLISTSRSSFGGFAKDSPLQYQMLKEAKGFMPKLTRVKIINAPLSYGFLNESLVAQANQIHQEINQSITIVDWEESALSDNRKKVLRKSLNNGFAFQEVGLEKLKLVYDIIFFNRKRKGFPTTMSYEQLKNVVSSFPNYYRLFLVINSRGEALSSAVVIKINSEISYLFYLGSGAQELSGNTFLVVQLIKKLQIEGVKQFDLGVSSVNGEVNKGLFRFKEGFGSTPSDKLTLIY